MLYNTNEGIHNTVVLVQYLKVFETANEGFRLNLNCKRQTVTQFAVWVNTGFLSYPATAGYFPLYCTAGIFLFLKISRRWDLIRSCHHSIDSLKMS